MVQKFVFDPQTLIDEEKEKEKNKVKKVLSKQEEFDKKVEEENAKAEIKQDAEKRKGIVSEIDLLQSEKRLNNIITYNNPY